MILQSVSLIIKTQDIICPERVCMGEKSKGRKEDKKPKAKKAAK